MKRDKPIRALFDVNVVLDVLAYRQPFYQDSAELWSLVERRNIEGLLAAHSITTIFYLYARQTSRQAASLSIGRLLKVFQVAAIDQPVIEAALQYGWVDFKDAVQMAAAKAADCDYLVTRNPQDFKPTDVQTIQPADLLAIISGKTNSLK